MGRGEALAGASRVPRWEGLSPAGAPFGSPADEDTPERCAAPPTAETQAAPHTLWSAGLEYTPQRLDHNG